MRILIVDDDAQILKALRITLAARGYEVTLARIRALTRRSPLEADPPVIEFGNVRVDLAAHEVNKADAAGARSPIKLTPTEWHILEVLVRNPRRPVTKHYLLTTVWGPAYETEGEYLRSTSHGCAGSWNRSRPAPAIS